MKRRFGSRWHPYLGIGHLLAIVVTATSALSHDLPPDWEPGGADPRVKWSCAPGMNCPDQESAELLVDPAVFDAFPYDGIIDSTELQCAIDCLDGDWKPEYYLEGGAPTLQESYVQGCSNSAVDWVRIPHGRIVSFMPTTTYLLTEPVRLPLALDGPLILRGNGAVIQGAPTFGATGVFRMIQRLRPSGRDVAGADSPWSLPGAGNVCDVEKMCPYGNAWIIEGFRFVGPGPSATGVTQSKALELHGTSLLVVRQCTFESFDVGLDLRFALSPNVQECVFKNIGLDGLRFGHGFATCESDQLSCWVAGCQVTDTPPDPVLCQAPGHPCCTVANCTRPGATPCDVRIGPLATSGEKYMGVLSTNHVNTAFCTQPSVRRTLHDMAANQRAGIMLDRSAPSVWIEESEFVASPLGPPTHFVLATGGGDAAHFVTRNLRFDYDSTAPPEAMMRYEMLKELWPIDGLSLRARLGDPMLPAQMAVVFDLSGMLDWSALMRWRSCEFNQDIPYFGEGYLPQVAVLTTNIAALPTDVAFKPYRQPACQESRSGGIAPCVAWYECPCDPCRPCAPMENPTPCVFIDGAGGAPRVWTDALWACPDLVDRLNHATASDRAYCSGLT